MTWLEQNYQIPNKQKALSHVMRRTSKFLNLVFTDTLFLSNSVVKQFEIKVSHLTEIIRRDFTS